MISSMRGYDVRVMESRVSEKAGVLQNTPAMLKPILTDNDHWTSTVKVTEGCVASVPTYQYDVRPLVHLA